MQAFFERHGLAGMMKTTGPKEDYLNIVHTSVGGNKSDVYVAEDITHDTYIHSDGSLKDELLIKRTHSWNEKTEQNIKAVAAAFGFSNVSKSVMEILGRSRNLHMLRIYVPAGAKLEDSSDPSVMEHFDKETGKTYFSAAINAPVGQSKTLKIRYSLPFKLDLDPVDKYALSVQKQPGQQNIILQKRMFSESRVLNYKYFPAAGTFDADGVWMFETELNKDIGFSSVWGK